MSIDLFGDEPDVFPDDAALTSWAIHNDHADGARDDEDPAELDTGLYLGGDHPEGRAHTIGDIANEQRYAEEGTNA